MRAHNSFERVTSEIFNYEPRPVTSFCLLAASSCLPTERTPMILKNDSSSPILLSICTPENTAAHRDNSVGLALIYTAKSGVKPECILRNKFLNTCLASLTAFLTP